ncbi:MAG: OmpA family protein [Deltaproteobacteria bacterium]|nr:OmpA family protein [Deltaproteobacteria bacterium]
MSSPSSPNALPDWREPLVSAPSDGDDTGWLVTFSDLVLQLFAFVVVAAVCGGAIRQSAPSASVVSAAPAAARVAAAPANTIDAAYTRAETRHPYATRDAAGTPPASAPRREPALAAFEPAAAWAGDAVPAVAPVLRAADAAPLAERWRRPEAIEPMKPAAIAEDAHDEALRPVIVAEPIADGPSPASAPRVRALGRYFSAFVAASADADEVTVTAGDADVRLAFGGRLGFRPGSAELSSPGRNLLREVQRLASGVPDLAIEVAGYTDDEPIHTHEFPSNLELSLSRAARVARELQRDDPTLAVRTVALGFGEHHAIAPNDGPENRARNRRVEVRLVPRDQSMP